MAVENDIKQKVDRLETVPQDLESGSLLSQTDLLLILLGLLATLETVNGNLVLNSTNTALIDSIIFEALEKLYEGDFKTIIRKYSSEFEVQRLLNDKIFNQTIEAFKPEDIYKENLALSRKNAITLLNKDHIAAQAMQALRNELVNSVGNQLSFPRMIDRITEAYSGNDGELLKYVKRVSRDAFAISDSSYSMLVASELGINWFRYEGGIVKNTRDFCKERDGKFWHIDEIRSWASDDWQGKNPKTTPDNITVLRGGFNCLHAFIPADVAQVPAMAIERQNRFRSAA